MRKPRLKPPVKPTASLTRNITREIGKKYRSILHRPKRTLTSWKNYVKPAHYNPKKIATGYAKNYYKNVTLPLARPYRRAKATYKKIQRILKPITNYSKEYAKQLNKYNKRTEKYNKAWEKYRNHLEERKEQRKKEKEEFRKNFQGFVKKEDVQVGDWTLETSGLANSFTVWREQKISEMRKKWNKAQLFYVPRMDLEGYNAIQKSPERIWAYYKGDAQDIFPTVEVFREFLDDYFSLGGFISKGVSGMMLSKLEKVGTLKEISKITKYLKFIM